MLRLRAAALAASLVLLLAASASAQNFTSTATLSGGEETPGLLTGAGGTVEVTVDPVAQEVVVTLRVFNMPTTSTAGHIHVGAKGVAGPVVLDFPAMNGRVGDFNVSFRLGPAAFRARPEIGINTIDDLFQAIAVGNAYVNVHSTTNAAGEIRGQLTVVRQ